MQIILIRVVLEIFKNMTTGFCSPTFTVLVAALGLIGAAIAYTFRESFPPFFVVFAFLFALLIILSLQLKRGRVYVYNAAFIFLALAIGEFLFRNDGRMPGRPATHYEGPYSAKYYQRDKELGYSVQPGRRTVPAAKKFKDGKVIYNVTYTIDQFGLRATPNIASGKNSVFFFGCSFAFGEGVNDDDSLPYLYSVLSGRRTRNFALHGYGPHQMLRALETDRPKFLGIPESPSLVVYVAINDYVGHVDHVDRAAGRAVWDPFGPRYEVENGKAQYVGPFSYELTRWLKRALGYSRIAGRLAFTVERQQDLERFAAIIRKSRDLVTEKYAVPFLVLLWEIQANPWESNTTGWILRRLTRDNINFIRLSRVIPGLERSEYYIPSDGHPNGMAQREVAKVIYDWFNRTNIIDE